MTRYSASRGIMYTTPPGGASENEAETTPSAETEEPATADD
ncbi:MAG: hypothetical protein V5A55_00690 [Halovenus sp.]